MCAAKINTLIKCKNSSTMNTCLSSKFGNKLHACNRSDASPLIDTLDTCFESVYDGTCENQYYGFKDCARQCMSIAPSFQNSLCADELNSLIKCKNSSTMSSCLAPDRTYACNDDDANQLMFRAKDCFGRVFDTTCVSEFTSVNQCATKCTTKSSSFDNNVQPPSFGDSVCAAELNALTKCKNSSTLNSCLSSRLYRMNGRYACNNIDAYHLIVDTEECFWTGTDNTCQNEYFSVDVCAKTCMIGDGTFPQWIEEHLGCHVLYFVSMFVKNC